MNEGIDAALRIGPLTDSSAVAHKLGTVSRVLTASPTYLAKAGTPRRPSELSSHSLIVGPAGRGTEGWTFRKNGKSTSVRVEGRFILNGAEGAVSAAVAGLGIVSSGFFGMLRELQSAELVRVLPGWEMMPADVNLILPAGRAAKASAKAFSRFVGDVLRELDKEWDRFNVQKIERL